MENSKKSIKKRVPAKTTCRNRTKEINKLSKTIISQKKGKGNKMGNFELENLMENYEFSKSLLKRTTNWELKKEIRKNMKDISKKIDQLLEEQERLDINF